MPAPPGDSDSEPGSLWGYLCFFFPYVRGANPPLTGRGAEKAGGMAQSPLPLCTWGWSTALSGRGRCGWFGAAPSSPAGCAAAPSSASPPPASAAPPPGSAAPRSFPSSCRGESTGEEVGTVATGLLKVFYFFFPIEEVGLCKVIHISSVCPGSVTVLAFGGRGCSLCGLSWIIHFYFYFFGKGEGLKHCQWIAQV